MNLQSQINNRTVARRDIDEEGSVIAEDASHMGRGGGLGCLQKCLKSGSPERLFST